MEIGNIIIYKKLQYFCWSLPTHTYQLKYNKYMYSYSQDTTMYEFAAAGKQIE